MCHAILTQCYCLDSRPIICTDRDAVLHLIENVAEQISATASNKLFFLLDYSLTPREERGEGDDSSIIDVDNIKVSIWVGASIYRLGLD